MPGHYPPADSTIPWGAQCAIEETGDGGWFYIGPERNHPEERGVFQHISTDETRVFKFEEMIVLWK